MKKVFKSCSIYRKPRGFFLFGYMHTHYGEVGRPPATKLPLTATPLDLGDTTLRILKELSGEILDVNLAEAMAAFRTHLRELGFKSVAEFEKNASVTSVEFDGESYKVISSQKDEYDANVATDSQKLLPSASAEELGNAILVALGNNR